ncbi:MAG TPA: MFS transporter, partial [Thermomicrobiaceae bacterium]|nr:MFS transporter [Thermomicrobiaceae bacterium]
MATFARRRPAPDILKNRALLTLMFGHFTNDLVGGFIPVLFPLLTARFDVNLSTVGLVSLAYSGMSSITQPFFGWLADRYGTRLIGAAIIWSAIAFAGIGFAPSFHLVVLLAGLAGIGSGLFHPFGALNAGAVIPPRQRNSAMSIYVSGGSIGFSMGPLIGVGLLALFGLRGTAVWVIPGIVMASFLLVGMRTIALPGARRSTMATAPSAPGSRRVLITVTLVMMLVSWNISAIESFVPIWYKDLGYGSGFYGPLTTAIILGGVAGALSAGALADRLNRRLLVGITFALSIPAILL